MQLGMRIYAYVIMSNHIHCILGSEEKKLSDTIRDFKKYTSKAIIEELINSTKESRKDWLIMIFRYHARFNKRNTEFQFWTNENHAVELDDNKMIESRINYIHQNPVRAGIVENEFDYLYSSARNFTEMNYLIEIDEM
jgi:REP element-mobilizing transposase RayT